LETGGYFTVRPSTPLCPLLFLEYPPPSPLKKKKNLKSLNGKRHGNRKNISFLSFLDFIFKHYVGSEKIFIGSVFTGNLGSDLASVSIFTD